ncbi:MAG TPA: Na+/H+ antiporter NhaA [Gemmatimonadaceae bacterium]
MRILEPFQRFAASEAGSGIVLLASTACALAWANSPWQPAYVTLIHHSLPIGSGSFRLDLTVRQWINDCLMALFFLLVGLEIKREMLCGELASLRKSALPIAAATGGMIVPALLYAAVNGGGIGARGWGIPMATDIAFALGIAALLGPRVPVSLKIFLAAVAIVDDIGAVLVIAVFYTASIAWASLAVVAALVIVLALLNRAGVQRAAPYLVLGIVLWVAVLSSGVHATIAGVLLAFTIPANARSTESSLLERLEHALGTPIAFLVVPLFALANAGVRIGGAASSGVSLTVLAGVFIGLVLGKPLGISLAAWLAVRMRIAALPDSVSWRMLRGVSWLGGIGFTMSLFVGALAFADEALLDSAKIGVLLASCAAAFMGWLMLREPRLPDKKFRTEELESGRADRAPVRVPE